MIKVYEAETTEILRRFASGHISHPECVAALDAALAAAFADLKPDDLPIVRRILAANNKALITELKRRGHTLRASDTMLN